MDFKKGSELKSMHALHPIANEAVKRFVKKRESTYNPFYLSVLVRETRHNISNLLAEFDLQLPEFKNMVDQMSVSASFDEFYSALDQTNRDFLDQIIEQVDYIAEFEEQERMSHLFSPAPSHSPKKINFDPKRVPKKSLEAYLGRLIEFHNFGEVDQTVDIVTESTHSLGCFAVRSKQQSTFVKAYASLDDAIREVYTINAAQATWISQTRTPWLVLRGDSGITTIEGTHFIATDHTHMYDFWPRFKGTSLQKEIFEETKRMVGDFDEDSLPIRRLYTLAAFHAEMKDAFIPKEHELKFRRSLLKDSREYEESLSTMFNRKDSSFLLSAYQIAARILGEQPKTTFCNNGIKEDNWIEDRMVDFGTSGFNSECVDVERTVMLEGREKEKLREIYFTFRSIFENLFGQKYQIPSNYQRICDYAGLCESIKLVNWYSNNQNLVDSKTKDDEFRQGIMLVGEKDQTKLNAEFYRAINARYKKSTNAQRKQTYLNQTAVYVYRIFREAFDVVGSCMDLEEKLAPLQEKKENSSEAILLRRKQKEIMHELEELGLIEAYNRVNSMLDRLTQLPRLDYFEYPTDHAISIQYTPMQDLYSVQSPIAVALPF